MEQSNKLPQIRPPKKMDIRGNAPQPTYRAPTPSPAKPATPAKSPK